MTEQVKSDTRMAYSAGLPIVFGYFPIAMAFGLLAKNTGLSLLESSLTSILVYAGASQFMALDLIAGGVGAGSIILATFLLNLRHLMMSASLSVNLNEDTKGFLPIISFGITDETFSILSFNREKLKLPFILIINTMAYLSWNIGTVSGYLIGEILPLSLQTALGLGLYGMFAALLFPSFKGRAAYVKLAFIAGAVYSGIFFWGKLGSGWDIIIGIVLSTSMGVLLLGRELGEDV